MDSSPNFPLHALRPTELRNFPLLRPYFSGVMLAAYAELIFLFFFAGRSGARLAQTAKAWVWADQAWAANCCTEPPEGCPTSSWAFLLGSESRSCTSCYLSAPNTYFNPVHGVQDACGGSNLSPSLAYACSGVEVGRQGWCHAFLDILTRTMPMHTSLYARVWEPRRFCWLQKVAFTVFNTCMVSHRVSRVC